MGGCCTKQVQGPKKQNKDIDDKRMLKVGVDVLKKDFCIQVGYNRRAKKLTQMLLFLFLYKILTKRRKNQLFLFLEKYFISQ